jgi:methionyl aminopeptidase
MITIKSSREIELMKEAGRIVAIAHRKVKEAIAPGVSTFELDQIAEATIRSLGATPSFKGYGGFPGSICASINQVIIHGIPSKKIKLKTGDIISIDIGACYKAIMAIVQ